MSVGANELLTCVYAHNGEMVRHFDRLKYTVWTVYTALIAGLWVAKGAGEISRGWMLGLTVATSLYFIFLATRIQRNYKIFYSSSHAIEEHMLASLPPAVAEALPFIGAGKQYGSQFWKTNEWDRKAGRIPYFHLQIAFFIIIPAGMLIMYVLR